MKIIILCPDLNDPGGVASYYMKLKTKFTIPVKYFTIAKRPDEIGILSIIHRLFGDYVGFIKNLRKNQIEIVQLNPSMDFKSVSRDGIFLLLALMFKKKTIIFFHGWVKSFEKYIERYGLWFFTLLYNRAEVFIVLSKAFKRKLMDWGSSQPIYNEVTVVDDDDLKGFDIQSATKERLSSPQWRILFIARILREKGIYETVETLSILLAKHPNIELIIAGDGVELEGVKSFVQSRSISNIFFVGYVRDDEKIKLLKSSHILCFPSYYGEGMPNTVMECMAFGLPVVTRPVGGIADFFIDGEHGFITTSKKPEVFAHLIEKLLINQGLYKKIAFSNYQYAQTNFLASQAALRIEKIYKYLLIDL